jgi:hypothetical protein
MYERCGYKYVATCPNVATKDGERCSDHANRPLAEHDAAIRADERARWVRVLREWLARVGPPPTSFIANAIERDDDTPWEEKK